MSEIQNEGFRAKLAALAGTPLSDLDVVDVLAEAIAAGGGVHVEIDDATRYKLIRREGRFVLSKESGRGRASVPTRSSIPPRK